MIPTLHSSLIFPLILCFAADVQAGEFIPGDSRMIVLDEGRTFRRFGDEIISGREVLNFLVDQSWDLELQAFIDHTICLSEIQSHKISISASDVSAELQNLLEVSAKRAGINPAQLTPEKLVKDFGLRGGVGVLRRFIHDNLGFLKVLQQDGKLPAHTRIHDREFQVAAQEQLEKWAGHKEIVRDPKKLGGGEAVRIGSRGYARDEVRLFIIEGLEQLPEPDLKKTLDFLQLERLVNHALDAKKITIKDDDLNFYYNYFCHKREAVSGVPGRVLVSQDLKNAGLTLEQFKHSRGFKVDAALARLARDMFVDDQPLKNEFEAHPERYKRSENLTAHIFIRVLDPDGKPYGPSWKVQGHESVNEYVSRQRDQQFALARPKIEGLAILARQNFEATAKKYSDDTITGTIGGIIGRIGTETILVPPCDNAVRSAAMQLKPGEISDPVRSFFGWHLIKCLEKQEVTFDEGKVRVYVNLISEEILKLYNQMINVKAEDTF